jgi:predicted nucleic-acid-binding protein
VIALDTNVLVRFLVQDDPRQAALATRLIEEVLTPAEPGFVSLIVLVELTWVLGRAYRCAQAQIADIVSELAASDTIVIERASIVTAALQSSRGDLADGLIHEIGRAHGCEWTATFDRRSARLDGVELLA